MHSRIFICILLSVLDYEFIIKQGGIMDRNLALEFVRATEAGAIAAARWMGKGDKNSADAAAVDEIRSRLNSINFSGKIVIGEGEKDEAPMLYTGELVGSGGVEFDIAIDPLEGTTGVEKGKGNSLSVLAAAPRGCLLSVPGTYMDQLCVGPKVTGVDINASPSDNINIVAESLGKDVDEITVCILERDRHAQLIKDVRKAGARVALIEYGTITAGIATCVDDSGIDIMMGVGGAPEAIITAAALKTLGGDMQAVLKPHKPKFLEQAQDMGFDDLDIVYNIDDLAQGDSCMFAATGITDGPFLKGVVFSGKKITTHSAVMRQKSGTIRWIQADHNCE